MGHELVIVGWTAHLGKKHNKFVSDVIKQVSSARVWLKVRKSSFLMTERTHHAEFMQKSGPCWSWASCSGDASTDLRFKLDPVTKHTSNSLYAQTLRLRPSHSVSATVFFLFIHLRVDQQREL